MHELLGRRCTHLTKSLHWIDTEVSQVPIFDGLSNFEYFLKEYEVQIPSSKRLQALDVALRATPARWWVAHKKNITTWEIYHRLLIIRFGEDGEAVQLVKLNGEVFPTLVNGSRLKLYKDNPPTHLA